MKTAGQKLHESLNDAGFGWGWNALTPDLKEAIEQAAKTTYEDDPRVISPEERLNDVLRSQSLDILSAHDNDFPANKAQIVVITEALDIMPKFPDGYLLPCPAPGCTHDTEYDAYKVMCGFATSHFYYDMMGSPFTDQQVIDSANAALWALGSRP